MSDDSKSPHHLNPDYGLGAARRRIRLTATAGSVEGYLVDIHHEMRCRIEHDGRVITGTSGEMVRVPTTICPGAVAVLDELVGFDLTTDPRVYYKQGRARRHCTHLFHLGVLSAAQACRDEAERIYDVFMADETDRPAKVEVSCNGEIVHQWQVRGGLIVSPPALAEQPLLSGFSSWANATFSGDMLEAAQVASQAYFVAQARRYLTDSVSGQPLSADPDRIGACYSYAAERVDTGRFLGGNVRDFTDGIVESPPA